MNHCLPIIFNPNTGYNMTTAVFTCPVRGLYHFYLTVLLNFILDIYCYIYHNSRYITYADTESNDHWASASVTVYLYLDIDIDSCINLLI